MDSEPHAAVLRDPYGPRWFRFLPHAVATLLLVSAIVLLPSFTAVGLLVGTLGVVLLASARFAQRSLSKRHVKLRFGDGFIDVAGGFADGRLRARDIEGATSSRTATGYRFVLQHASRPEPIALELRTMDDLRRTGRSLGVGLRGHGRLVFSARPSLLHHLEAALRIAICVLYPIFAITALANAGGWAVLTAIAMLFVTPAAIVVTVIRMATFTPTLRLHTYGIHVTHSSSYSDLPYTSLLELVSTPSGFIARMVGKNGAHVVPIEAGRHRLSLEGMADDDKVLFRELVLDAAARARGESSAIGDTSEAVSQLSLMPNEAGSTWLARLDALAATRNVAYRGSALTDDELLTALEDTELSAEVRAGAARVLARTGDHLRLRVAPVLAAEHDAAAKVRIAAAIDGRDEDLIELVDSLNVAKRIRR